MLALVVIAASVLANADALLDCTAHCVPNAATPNNWNACQYCDYACNDCFCAPNSLTKALCVEGCKNLWYSTPFSPKLVDFAANFLTEFPWTCDNTAGNSTTVCEFACTCSGSPDTNCISNCQRAAAAFTWSNTC